MRPTPWGGGDGNAPLAVEVDHASVVVPEYVSKVVRPVETYWKLSSFLVLLRWLRGLFNNADQAEAGSPLDVVLFFCQDEGLRSFHSKLDPVRPNAFLRRDLMEFSNSFCV